VAGIGAGQATLPMEGLIAIPVREAVDLYCRDSVRGSGNYASNAVIDAIQVASLHGPGRVGAG
jgi:hypothetical protein